MKDTYETYDPENDNSEMDFFKKAGHYAQLFCILFAFLVPSLLVWRVLL